MTTFKPRDIQETGPACILGTFTPTFPALQECPKNQRLLVEYVDPLFARGGCLFEKSSQFPLSTWDVWSGLSCRLLPLLCHLTSP